ncbi:MAG: hypothetical protein ABTD50_08805 [Polyangiaceae bacterium]
MTAWRTAVLVGTTALVGACNAHAVEREHQIGIDVGGAVLVVSDKSSADVGSAFGVHYAYGLSDQFLLLARASISPVAPDEHADSASSPNDRPAGFVAASIGAAYVFDVLRWVPYAGLLMGGYALYGGTLGGSPRVLPGVALVVGLDYRLDRAWSLGFSLHQDTLSEPGTYPSLTQGFAHADFHWGW